MEPTFVVSMVLHTLLSGALAVLENSFFQHLDHASLTLYRGDALLGNHVHLIYGPRVSSVPPDPFELYMKNDISCMCAGFLHGGSQLLYNATILSAAKNLHESYQQYLTAITAHPKQTNITLTDYVHSFSPHSCTLFDYSRMTVYMVSDPVGSIPLWYNLSPRSSFVVTSGTQSPVTNILVTSYLHSIPSPTPPPPTPPPPHTHSLPTYTPYSLLSPSRLTSCHAVTVTVTLPLSLSCCHCHTVTLSLSLSCCHCLAVTVTLSLSLSRCAGYPSSDLLGAQRLGYLKPLTPLGPGQIVVLYVSINTVDYLRWSPQQLALQVQAQTQLAQAQGQGQAQTHTQRQAQGQGRAQAQEQGHAQAQEQGHTQAQPQGQGRADARPFVPDDVDISIASSEDLDNLFPEEGMFAGMVFLPWMASSLITTSQRSHNDFCCDIDD